MKPNLLSQRTHDAITTSLWRQNDVAKSFWRRNDVISTRIRNCALSHVMASAQMLARICINSEEITVLITGAATQVITVFGQFGPAASPLWKKPHDKQCPFPWGSNYLHFVNYRWKAVPGKRSEWFVNLQHRILPRRLSGLYAKTFFFDYSFNYKRIVQDEKIYLYHFVLIYVCT